MIKPNPRLMKIPKNFSLLAKDGSNRKIWIDNCKGFLLFTVVGSHAGFTYMGVPMISLFYMSAFFFISGYLFKSSSASELGGYVKRKFYTLMVPYLVFNCLFLLLNPRVLPGVETDYSNADEINNLLMGFGVFRVRPLWFLFSLFQVSVAYAFISKLIAPSRYANLLLASVSLLLGYVCYIYGCNLFFHLDTFFTALFFYIIGYECRSLFTVRSWWKFLLMVIPLSVMFLMSVNKPNFFPNLCRNILYSNLLVYVIAEFSGIFCLLSVFSWLNDRKYMGGANMLLGAISKNSIVILAFHSIVINLSKHYLHIESPVLLVAGGLFVSLFLAPLFNNYLGFAIGKKNIKRTTL